MLKFYLEGLGICWHNFRYLVTISELTQYPMKTACTPIKELLEYGAIAELTRVD